MDSSLDIQHGLKGILLSLLGLLAAQIVKGLWVFARRNMWPSKVQFTELTKALTDTNKALENQKLVVEKMSQDMRRIYLYLKVIAGEKWPKYRKQVEEIENENL